MKTAFGQTLPDGHYMLWRVNKETDTPESIVAYFLNKYGYTPTQAALGKHVDLVFPMSSAIHSIYVQDYHIKMR